MATEALLTDAVVYLGAAVVAVPISKRLGLGSVIGYLAAGIAIGPFGLQLINDAETVLHFSEFGVVLLLFLIGLELKPSRLWAMRHAIFGLGALQVVATTALLAAAGSFLIDDRTTLFIVAAALALSSTAMAMQLLAEKRLVSSAAGQAAFGVLLFQDLAVIPFLAALPLLAAGSAATSGGDWIAIAHVAGVIFAILFGGRYVARHMFRVIAKTGLKEIFTAFALLLVIGIAMLMQAVGLSMALGTFLAGVVLADSEYRQQLEIELEPFKGLLMGLFFIAVGMSTDVRMLAQQWQLVAALVLAVLAIKFFVLYAIGRLFRLSTHQSLMFAALVSQVGEFAFVIFGVAGQLGLIGPQLSGPLIVVVSLSMVLTPLIILAVERLIAARLNVSEPESDVSIARNPVIIIGVGRMGQVISRMLIANDIPATVIDNDPDQVELSRRFAHEAYYGDARRLDLLEAAGIAEARLLVVACDDPAATLSIVDTVRAHYPDLPLAARARNRTHAYELFERGVYEVERETFFSSLALTERVLKQLGFAAGDAYDAVTMFRRHDEEMLQRLFDLRGEPNRLRESVIQSRRDFEQLMREEFGRPHAPEPEPD
jgi:glutathione-regulated potassium-efflux system ancillary protein KefC